jgi:hypothetical protein
MGQGKAPQHIQPQVCCVLLCRSARRASAADADTAAAAAKGKGAAAAVPVQLLNDSYAMQAAARAQKRRLCDMIRLLDYMLADAIHSMLLRSLQHMLQCMHGIAQPQQQDLGQALPSSPPQQQQQQQQQQGVVLRLELLLHSGTDQLHPKPHAGQFTEGLGVWLRSVERAVRGVQRLMAAASLQVRIWVRQKQHQQMPLGSLANWL